jgi:hypothetical protein
MRLRPCPSLPRLAAALAIAATALACSDSKMVTAPTTGTGSTSSASLAGAWSGSFSAYESKCGSSAASATFQQTGSTVTGILSTSGCGVGGAFVGTIEGNSLFGNIKMQGCIGGGVSGTVTESGIALAIGDMTKPLVTGDQILMAGGVVSLHR